MTINIDMWGLNYRMEKAVSIADYVVQFKKLLIYRNELKTFSNLECWFHGRFRLSLLHFSYLHRNAKNS